MPHLAAEHTCHWPSCRTPIEPARWGCAKHWFILPKSLRDKVWSSYRPGQEVTKTPSAAYIEAAREVQAWANNYEAQRALMPPPPLLKVKPTDAQAGFEF